MIAFFKKEHVTIIHDEKKDLREMLDRLYGDYNRKACLDDDPLFFVHTFEKKEDVEIAGLIASSLAYGTIQTIKKSVHEVLNLLKPSPSRFVRSFHHQGWEDVFGDFKHRFNSGEDMANLLFFIKQMMERSGSIENFFMEGYNTEHGIEGALISLSERALHLEKVRRGKRMKKKESRATTERNGGGVRFFFPSPRNGSACKRMNLFLRWMVRKDNLDVGLWKAISKSELIIPVDTHIVDSAQRLGLTKRKNPSWKMAVEITAALRRFDRDDPVKYDFALCHCRWPH